MLRVFIVFLLILLAPVAYAFTNDVSDFKQTLEEFLPVSKNYLETKNKQEVDIKNFQKVIDKLNQFNIKYPDSVFADDSQMLVMSALFLDAIKDKNKEKAQEIISQMQTFLDKTPNIKLEDYTIERCKRMMSIPVSSAILSVPYIYTPIFMRGILACQFQDYQGVVDNYILLKDKMDYNKDKFGLLGEEIYVKLYQAYEKLGKNDEAKALAKEAINKFPDNRNLRHYMKRMLKEAGDEEYAGKVKEEKDTIYGFGA